MLEGPAAPPAAAEAPAAEGAPAAAAPPPPPPPPRPEAEEALDLGAVGGAMVTDKLRDPRTLGVVVGLALLIAYLLGRRSAR
jgi:hypothetical protein